MSFGKRSPGNDNPRPPPPPPVDSETRERPSPAAGMRMSVAGAGAFDARFAVLAVGVMAIAAAGAFAVSMIGGSFVKVRPVAEIVTGLNREQVKAALALEALPDKHGQVFMATLKASFPSEHDKLLGQMAETAMRGGDRNTLAIDVNEWLLPFAIQNMSNLGRTGAAGFDFALETADAGLDYVSHTAGGCTAQTLTGPQSVFSDPNRILAEFSYGTKAYEFNIKTSTRLVALADAGRSAPSVAAQLTPQDEAALQSAMMSLMMDRDVMTLVQSGMSRNASGGVNIDSEALYRIDICKIGHTAIDRLRKLPPDTKARVWGVGMNELRKMVGPNGFQMPAPGQFGPGQYPSAQRGIDQLSLQ
ncbi:MAG TPA: hypothetical protein VGO52_19425 [Hyphomonadaceae bacterium]|nr:hypothetical protein [Hyphomonadaceae bacterium]